ncbi:MAG: hypothetical protein DRH24_08975 [Deltaproteobacteria bacterium]|nr:MAG: hypothetical protein DRH24_08975 [Deltaproteobacteria bacterium]
MRILHLIDTLGAGGKERQLTELLKGLSKRTGIDARLIILSETVHYSYVKRLGLRIYFLKRRIRRDPGVFLELFKICRQFQPDILHSWESMCSLYALPIAKILKIPFISGTVRDAPSKIKLFGKTWKRTRLTFFFSQIVLANSLAGLKSYNVPKDKGCCIYNGFDFSRADNLAEKQTVRKKYKITTPKVVGMVARFHPRKDYATFILSALQILERNRDVTFLAIGGGTTLNNCIKIVPAKFRNNIRFLGKLKEIESIVNIFDVGVLASYADGISNSIMEYMALGKPVVATDHGGTREIVIHNKTGFLVEPKNPEEMAAKIEFLLNDRETARVMGQEGYKRLRHEFSLEKMTKGYIELYRLCNRKSSI